jgi:hypothetical protein
MQTEGAYKLYMQLADLFLKLIMEPNTFHLNSQVLKIQQDQ